MTLRPGVKDKGQLTCKNVFPRISKGGNSLREVTAVFRTLLLSCWKLVECSKNFFGIERA